ncbi:helix-turn-helix transcriptional regulator [Ruania halotolerans]|uniref:helix-turn-helix transcriptional regulator n=1 Tax=Ruania halotolerans TaxID=2897773 RepID=UPI001E46509A|nr:WYL domain-containing protein [Ruania halotolerans]UFU08280.1 WYL domain-containing protein [Ruania halotolerans]
MAETAGDRVVRMLALIAYLENNRGVPVEQVAEHFGVSAGQVLMDVDTLWVSGTPGYMHDDLIDFAADDHERNLLTLTDSRGMDRPLRLGPQEALALLTALRTLQATPGLTDDAVLSSTADKLAQAAGAAAETSTSVDVRVADSSGADVSAHLSMIRAALRERRQVHLRYVSAADTVSERTVDPLQLLTDSHRWFLMAWCHRAADVRQFRLDRMLEARMLEAPVADHPDIALPESAEPELAAACWQVRLVLSSRARWVAEQYPVTAVTDLDDGRFAVELDVVDLAWLHNLVFGLGPDVQAVEPADVALGLSARARTALDAYAAAGLLEDEAATRYSDSARPDHADVP